MGKITNTKYIYVKGVRVKVTTVVSKTKILNYFTVKLYIVI